MNKMKNKYLSEQIIIISIYFLNIILFALIFIQSTILTDFFMMIIGFIQFIIIIYACMILQDKLDDKLKQKAIKISRSDF